VAGGEPYGFPGMVVVVVLGGNHRGSRVATLGPPGT
jgi:hypothetical protein